MPEEDAMEYCTLQIDALVLGNLGPAYVTTLFECTEDDVWDAVDIVLHARGL